MSNIGDNIFYILVYHPDSDEYYADYVLNVYQLDMKAYTFLKDGETWASGEIQEESAVNAPENPEKDGYTFNGWKVNGEFVSFPYTVLTDTTFIAGGFKPITYIVSYELNGSENDESNPETYNIEQAYTLKNPTRTGYDFKGWFTEETFDNQVTEITLGSYGDKKFYAKWTPTVYTIAYELNGGVNNAENPETYTIETETITLANPKTRTGYIFVGWFTEETFENQATEIKLGSYGDKKFYAKWTPTVYTVEYELNGGENHENNPETYNIEQAYTLKTPTRAGYTFTGWFTEETFDNPVTGIALGSHGDKKFYVRWTENINTLKFDGNGATIGEMSNMLIKTTETVVLAKYGYHKNNCYFVGWALTPDGEVVYEDCATYTMGTENEYTLYAVWEYGTDGIKYTLSDDGMYYSVSGYSGTETNIKIPSAYNDLLITSIGNYAFDGCSSLTNVTIPDSVTSIGNYAFKDCSSLMSVEIPDSVTSIGGYAFYDCDGLTNIIIPNGVTSIGSSAFRDCSSLTSIEIPDGVTSIGSWAFYNCSSLTNVYYKGTAEEWSVITINSYNTPLTNATRYYYSETAPALNADGTAYDGNYWHYDENGEIVVWVYVKPEE